MDNLENPHELDEKTLSLISDMEAEIIGKNKELDNKDKEIKELKNRLEYLESQIINAKNKLYGKSSEQVSDKQLALFNEAEKYSDTKIEEPDIEEITYHRNKSSKKKTKEESFASLETVVIEHKLDESEQVCKECNDELHIIGKKSKKILKYKPAELYVEEHITYSYGCRTCETQGDKSNIVETKAPKTFLYKSMASSELLSHIIYLKYSQAMPLYRQENYFAMMNVKLYRQTLSNWMMKSAEEFETIYEVMKNQLLKSHYIQADETTVQVLKENGTESKSKKYMWLYKTGQSTHPIILYDYQPTRASSCPKKFLKGFTGYLQTDGYIGYNKVEKVKWISCLAHIRRKFYEIIKPLDEKAIKSSRAILGFNYCEQLYKIEKELREDYQKKDDYYEKRYAIRLEKSAPILEEFIKYVEKEIEEAMPKSPLGKALEYACKQLPKLKYFLEDGSIEIDNNGAERAIKPFVIGRKNWLFMNTGQGAKASAIIYSIIETTKANGLKIEKYLTYLMNNLANIEDKTAETLLPLMPWSEELPEDLKVRT